MGFCWKRRASIGGSEAGLEASETGEGKWGF